MNFVIKHAASKIDFDELFDEIHKLIPSFEDIPREIETRKSLIKRIEDLDGDYVEPVRFEDTEGNAID